MFDRFHHAITRIAVAVAFCTLLAFGALADSNITVTGVSGNLEPGGTLIITGYGFGVKSPALPKIWDNFEGQPIGTSVGDPVHGEYTRVGSSRYSSASPYTGEVCAHSRVPSDDGSPGLVSNWIPYEAKDAFASMKFKLVSSFGSLEPHNIKLLRLNAHDPDPTHGYPNYNIQNERDYSNFKGIVNHGLWGQVYNGGFTPPYPTGWNSVAIWDHLGDPDVDNGFAGMAYNGSVSQKDNIVTLQSGHLNGIRAAYFCGYVGHGGGEADIYLDDVYADITLARVLVRQPGSSFEMQIPQEWNGTRIEVTANPGRYETGAELQLIVFDEDNNASAPFTVFVGENESGGGDDDPGAPGSPEDVLLLLAD